MLLLLPPCLVCLLTSSGLINGLSGWCTNTSFLHFSLCLFGFSVWKVISANRLHRSNRSSLLATFKRLIIKT